MKNINDYFKEYYLAHGDKLLFTAHSHHPWPDASQKWQQLCWQDANRLLDQKWDHIFTNIYPKAQSFITHLTKIQDLNRVVFGQNTHEFLFRLLSCIPNKSNNAKKPRILSSDSEFYSFTRQMCRLEQDNLVDWQKIPVAEFHDFKERFERCLDEEFDLIYISHVFFNSGFINPCLDLLNKKASSSNAVVVVDGYHALGAIDVDLSSFDHIFYLGGGYKYLSAGEGVCFLISPQKCTLEPIYTGWFADTNTLSHGQNHRVLYSEGAQRFAGATFDPVGIYRLCGISEFWQDAGLNSKVIHEHVRSMQHLFLSLLEQHHDRFDFNLKHLIGFRDFSDWGNFLCFKTPDHQRLVQKLLSQGIYIDGRPGLVRFGLSYLHQKEDIYKLITNDNQLIQ